MGKLPSYNFDGDNSQLYASSSESGQSDYAVQNE